MVLKMLKKQITVLCTKRHNKLQNIYREKYAREPVIEIMPDGSHLKN